MLDAVSADVPIWVMCYAPHIVYTNSPMLAQTKADVTNQQHGVGRYADGRLNGWFVETGAIALAMAPEQQYLASPGSGEAALRLLARAAVHNGVTSVADMGWGLMDFEMEWADHHRLSLDESFPLRVFLVAFEPRLRAMFEAERFAFLEQKAARLESAQHVLHDLAQLKPDPATMRQLTEVEKQLARVRDLAAGMQPMVEVPAGAATPALPETLSFQRRMPPPAPDSFKSDAMTRATRDY